LGVSRSGEFKNMIKICLQKVHAENFFRENSQEIDKNFNISFFSTFFVLSRFQVLLSDGISKTLQKMFCEKIVSKSFSNKSGKKTKTDFFPRFVLLRFWAFLGEGSLNKNTIKNLGIFFRPALQPWYFFRRRGTNQPRST
jgi:hypothetical protein